MPVLRGLPWRTIGPWDPGNSLWIDESAIRVEDRRKLRHFRLDMRQITLFCNFWFKIVNSSNGKLRHWNTCSGISNVRMVPQPQGCVFGIATEFYLYVRPNVDCSFTTWARLFIASALYGKIRPLTQKLEDNACSSTCALYLPKKQSALFDQHDINQ